MYTITFSNEYTELRDAIENREHADIDAARHELLQGFIYIRDNFGSCGLQLKEDELIFDGSYAEIVEE